MSESINRWLFIACCLCVCAVEIVEVPVHDTALSTSPLIPSPVSPISKVQPHLVSVVR